jgi:predicted aspartyl protease
VGTFKADFVIRNRADTGRSQALSGVVDTGASYTVVPATILDALGVEQEQSINFTLADGSKRDMDIGWVQMELEGRTGHVYVVFGPDNSPVLLGAMALETFALAADAKNRCLVPGQATL